MMDLTTHPPRRWNEALEGYLWLPRLIDKVRAFQSGKLGHYAYPSYLDRVFLRQLGLSPAFIEQTVRQYEMDEPIGRAVRAQSRHTSEEIQRCNEQFARRWRFVLNLMDRDDGYVRGRGYLIPGWLQPIVWRSYQRWAARKASATQL